MPGTFNRIKIACAKEKAVSMAKCLGAKVGPVLHIEEVPNQNLVQRAQYESRAGSK